MNKKGEDRMQKIYYDPTRCKGCHYCVMVCPKKAVSLSGENNDKGYPTVVFDQELCIAYNSCYKICPDYAIEVHRP